MPSRIFFAALLAAMAMPALAANPLPQLVWSFPDNESTVTEPVQFVQLKFDRPVDLVAVDLQSPDETRLPLYDAMTDPIPMKTDSEFAITLPAAVSAPGQYYVNYAISVTHAANRTDAVAGFAGFVIEDPQADEE